MDIAGTDQVSQTALALGALSGAVIHVGWFWFLAYRTGVLRAFGGIALSWKSLGALTLLAFMPIVFLGAWSFAPVTIPGVDQAASTLLVMSGTTTVGIYVMNAIAGWISTPSSQEVRRMREEMEAQRWGS